jgi:hypothetical protein
MRTLRQLKKINSEMRDLQNGKSKDNVTKEDEGGNEKREKMQNSCVGRKM